MAHDSCRPSPPTLPVAQPPLERLRLMPLGNNNIQSNSYKLRNPIPIKHPLALASTPVRFLMFPENLTCHSWPYCSKTNPFQHQCRFETIAAHATGFHVCEANLWLVVVDEELSGFCLKHLKQAGTKEISCQDIRAWAHTMDQKDIILNYL